MARVVIVEDSAFMKVLLESTLTDAGHEVVGIGKDGNEALSLYKKLKPDLITLDILMPGSDGLTALKNIMEFDSQARVVMVSSVGLDSKAEEARRLGACDYIKKPFTNNDILKSVAAALNRGNTCGE
jgi:two-component system chemotaxis response regulator CheY